MKFLACALLVAVHCTHPKFSDIKDVCKKRISRQQAQSAPLTEPDQVHGSHKEIWALVRVSEFISRDLELVGSVEALKTKLSDGISSDKAFFTSKFHFSRGCYDTKYTPCEYSDDSWMDIMGQCVSRCLRLWSQYAEAIVSKKDLVRGSEDHIAVCKFWDGSSRHASKCRAWLKKNFAYYTDAFEAANKKEYTFKSDYSNFVLGLFEELRKDVHEYFVNALHFFYYYCISDLSARITNCCYKIMLEDKFAVYKRKYLAEKRAVGSAWVAPETPLWLSPHMLYAGIVKKAELEFFDRIIELHGDNTLVPELGTQIEEVLLPRILKQALEGEIDILLREFVERFTEYPSLNRDANRLTALVGFQLKSLETIRAVRDGYGYWVTNPPKSLRAFYKLYMDNVDERNRDADTATIVDLSKQIFTTLQSLCKQNNYQPSFSEAWGEMTGEIRFLW